LERYYLGVDWSDKFYQVWVSDGQGQKVAEQKVVENVAGLIEFGRWLDESRSQGIELWAAIEKPQGRIVDFLLVMGWWAIRSTPRRWIGPEIDFA
jgi:hypothetical protein